MAISKNAERKIVPLPEVPQYVRDYLLHSPFVTRQLKSAEFMSFLTKENGVMTERIYAWRSDGKDLQIIEVENRDEKDLKHCHARQIGHAMMGGWNCYWPGEKAINSYFYYSDSFCDSEGYEAFFSEFTEESRRVKLWAYRAWTIEDVYKMDPTLKYLPLTYEDTQDITRVIGLYRKCPKIEILRKLGYSNISNDARFPKLSEKTLRNMMIWLKNNPYKAAKDGDYHESYSLQEVLFLMKHPDFTLLDVRQGWNTPEKRKMGRYLAKQKESDWTYNDYIESAKKLHYDMNDEKVLFPNHLKKAHDEAFNAVQVKAKNSLNKGIKKQSEKYSIADMQIGHYEFSVPKDEMDFVEQANELNQCLVKCDYDKKYSEGQEVLIFIKKDGKRWATAELLKSRGKFVKLNQFYGNHDINPDKETQEAFDGYLEQYKATVYKKQSLFPSIPVIKNPIGCSSMVMGA